MSKEKILKNVETMIKKNKLTTKEEIKNHLNDLKNRGLLTKGQVDMVTDDFCDMLNCGVKTSKTGTRAPRTMEYAYSNVSAGFSKTGMLILIAMSVPVLIATMVMLNK